MTKTDASRPSSESSGAADVLRSAASALTLASGAIALVAEILDHFRKPKAGPHERTRTGTVLLGLTVLRTLPSLIRNAKSLSADIKRAK